MTQRLADLPEKEVSLGIGLGGVAVCLMPEPDPIKPAIRPRRLLGKAMSYSEILEGHRQDVAAEVAT